MQTPFLTVFAMLLMIKAFFNFFNKNSPIVIINVI